MKKFFLIIFLMVAVNCFSQNKQVLYNFTSVPQSLMSNPGADVKYKVYFGMPFFSGISANVGSTSFSAYDLFSNNGVNFNVKLRNVLNSTSRGDHLNANQQLEILNAGFSIGTDENKSYLSFGMYQEFDLMGYAPKDPAILALDGNQPYLGKYFNLNDLSMKAEILSVLHFGIHKNIGENLIVGFRAKIYSSIYNVSSTHNSGYIYTDTNTSTSGPIYNQIISSDIQINTSGLSKFRKNFNGDVLSDIKQKALFGGNLGLGFDAGITYYLKPNLQFTASVVDVGFVSHTKEVKIFKYKGYFEQNGILPLFDGNLTKNSFDEFKSAIPLDSSATSYTTLRPIKFNSSIEYSYGEEYEEVCNCSNNNSGIVYRNAVGAQLFMMSTPRMPLFALTGYYRRKIIDALQLKVTYTIDSYSYRNIGLGLSSNLGPVNFYLMADNLLEYQDLSKARSLSFQLGLNFIFKE